MTIPPSNRTVCVTINELSLKDQPRVGYNYHELIDTSKAQLPALSDLAECFVWRARNKVWVTCKSTRAVDEFMHAGLLFRGQPVDIKPVSSYTWVNIVRVPYGVPAEEVTRVLSL